MTPTADLRRLAAAAAIREPGALRAGPPLARRGKRGTREDVMHFDVAVG
jgi:hypothetical protein